MQNLQNLYKRFFGSCILIWVRWRVEVEVGSSAIRKELGSIAHDSERRETGDVLSALSWPV